MTFPISSISPPSLRRQNLTLLKALCIVLLCYMPPNILRKILRYYRCYHIIHSTIRGCESVFVSINRLTYLLCIK